MNLEETLGEKVNDLRKAGFSEDDILLMVLKTTLKILKIRVKV